MDVEAYVIETIQEAAPQLSDDDLDELVLSGIRSVQRVERALPPQRPLLPVLEKVLAPRLIALAVALEGDRSAPARPGAIAA